MLGFVWQPLLDHLKIRSEREAQSGVLRNDDPAIFDDGRLFIQAERPWHEFYGQAVGYGSDEVRMNLRHEMTDDRNIERFGKRSHLTSLCDAAYTEKVDHSNVDRPISIRSGKSARKTRDSAFVIFTRHPPTIR